MNSGEIEVQIVKLIDDYVEAVTNELKEVDQYTLMSIIRTKSSQWSGGHSVSNMLEQIIRDLAIRRLDVGIK